MTTIAICVKNVLTQRIVLNCTIVVIVLIAISVHFATDAQNVRIAMMCPAVRNALIVVCALIVIIVKI